MKKGIKRHLMEIFLKQEFLELSDKEKQEDIKKTFQHDLKWVIGSSIFLIVAFGIIYITGVFSST
jgi:hypothetical protein